MNHNLASIDVLLPEYETFVHEAKNGKSDMGEVAWDRLESLLSEHGSWTVQAAAQIVWLVRRYGAFVLRNALALAIATGIEDGNSRL